MRHMTGRSVPPYAELGDVLGRDGRLVVLHQLHHLTHHVSLLLQTLDLFAVSRHTSVRPDRRDGRNETPRQLSEQTTIPVL